MILLAILLWGMFAGWVANMILGGGSRPAELGPLLVAGLAGSFVGGMLASLISGDGLSLRPSGLIGTIVGAVRMLAAAAPSGAEELAVQGAAVEDRREAGRALRKAVARSAHARTGQRTGPGGPGPGRQRGPRRRPRTGPPPPHGRLGVHLLPGHRVADGARTWATTPTTGVTVQTCGDAHLSNFGFFATPERRLTFDLNDFDETHRPVGVGPQAPGGRRSPRPPKLPGTGRRRSLDRWRPGLGGTGTALATYATRPTLDVWFDAIDLDSTLPSVRRKGNREVLERVMRQARRRTNPQAVARLTHTTDEGRRFHDDLPLMWRLPERAAHTHTSTR